MKGWVISKMTQPFILTTIVMGSRQTLSNFYIFKLRFVKRHWFLHVQI